MGKFVITRKKDGLFQFDFRDESGQIILQGGTYTRKTICAHGINSVKQNSQDVSKFIKKTSIYDNTYYFILKSFNGKIIAKSKLFEERDLRNNLIVSVKNNALEAIIEDLTKIRKTKRKTKNHNKVGAIKPQNIKV